jgi:hypothetical protein
MSSSQAQDRMQKRFLLVSTSVELKSGAPSLMLASKGSVSHVLPWSACSQTSDDRTVAGKKFDRQS